MFDEEECMVHYECASAKKLIDPFTEEYTCKEYALRCKLCSRRFHDTYGVLSHYWDRFGCPFCK